MSTQSKTKSIADAIIAFKELDEKSLTYNIADDYFQSFGVGNVIQAVHIPWERLIHYESLLKALKATDSSKLDGMHKGTPYYFLAWASFDIKDYERALFYLDAAIAEDIRLWGNGWTDTPVGNMLTFIEGGTAIRIIQELKSEFERLISQSCSDFNIQIELKQFVDDFVIPLINSDKKNRSVITSFYSFVLEFQDRREMLNLRSSEGGTIEPFLVHLLKGTLIFETLIKIVGHNKDWKIDSGGKRLGESIRTIGELHYSSSFTSKYCSLEDAREINNLHDVMDFIKTNDIKTAINVTYFVRNKIAHDLRWDDIFEDIEKYELLFKQVFNAILILIFKEFLEK